VAHKVAPVLAVGAPVIIKPAPKTPLSALDCTNEHVLVLTGIEL
jgi:acyl-CoA reductase-like NAD-dependent aldehyde dehydrogenase